MSGGGRINRNVRTDIKVTPFASVSNQSHPPDFLTNKNKSMKKEIKQVDKFGDVSFQVGRDGISLIQIADGATNWVIIEKSKAREVALAICPELGEPTIKTDNTKVIAHLESELEKAKELLKKYIDQNRISKDGLVTIIDRNVFVETITFLEGK